MCLNRYAWWNADRVYESRRVRYLLKSVCLLYGHKTFRFDKPGADRLLTEFDRACDQQMCADHGCLDAPVEDGGATRYKKWLLEYDACFYGFKGWFATHPDDEGEVIAAFTLAALIDDIESR